MTAIPSTQLGAGINIEGYLEINCIPVILYFLSFFKGFSYYSCKTYISSLGLIGVSNGYQLSFHSLYLSANLSIGPFHPSFMENTLTVWGTSLIPGWSILYILWSA